jgi:general nucleoside transport system ATP-binding protein
MGVWGLRPQRGPGAEPLAFLPQRHDSRTISSGHTAVRGVPRDREILPGVIANEDVSLDIRPGEIHALLGENDAGKSTLMNILTGIYQPDAGEIIIDGYGASFASPVEAIAAGIGMVHQHFKLVQAFTVAENIHLGWVETPRLASAAALEARTAARAEPYRREIR